MAPKLLLLIGALSTTSQAFQFGPTSRLPSFDLPHKAYTDAKAPLEHAIDSGRQVVATAALASTLAFGALSIDPSSASAADSSRTIQVELDAPVLVKRLNNAKYQRELIDAFREVQDVVGPDAVSVKPPSNTGGAIRDLLSGRGEVTVNGQPVDVAVLGSERGEITIKISNPFLPKVPILSTSANIPFLSDRASEEPVPIGEKPSLKAILGQAYGWDMTTPFFDQKFLGGKFGITVPRADENGGPFKYVPTNKDVVGYTSLALGGVYAGSFAYYQSLIEAEERKLEENAAKKKEAAAKKKEAAAKKAKDSPAKKAKDAPAKKAKVVKPQLAVTKSDTRASDKKKTDTEAKVENKSNTKTGEAAKKTKKTKPGKEKVAEEAKAEEPKKRSRIRGLFSRGK